MGITPDKFQLITNPSVYMERKRRSFLYGTEIAALHATTEFKIRKPIKFSNLNVSSTYSALECCDDLQRILQAAV